MLFEFCVEKLPMHVEQPSRFGPVAVGFSERLGEQKSLESTDRRMKIQFQQLLDLSFGRTVRRGHLQVAGVDHSAANG